MENLNSQSNEVDHHTGNSINLALGGFSHNQTQNLKLSSMHPSAQQLHKSSSVTPSSAAVVVEEPSILTQATGQQLFPHPTKMSTMDAEAFYMERSKSVIKRREELEKKKQVEIQRKIEAKNIKIEQLKYTRNGQLNSSSQAAGKTSKSQHSFINSNPNEQNQEQRSQYTSKQRESVVIDTFRLQNSSLGNSRSTTPLKQGKHSEMDKSQRVSHLTHKQFDSIVQESPSKQQQLNKHQVERPKSQGKQHIKFDKRG